MPWLRAQLVNIVRYVLASSDFPLKDEGRAMEFLLDSERCAEFVEAKPEARACKAVTRVAKSAWETVDIGGVGGSGENRAFFGLVWAGEGERMRFGVEAPEVLSGGGKGLGDEAAGGGSLGSFGFTQIWSFGSGLI
jgi:hypothetical protein